MPGDLPERGEVGVYRQLERVTGVAVDEIERMVLAGIEVNGVYETEVIKPDIE